MSMKVDFHVRRNLPRSFSCQKCIDIATCFERRHITQSSTFLLKYLHTRMLRIRWMNEDLFVFWTKIFRLMFILPFRNPLLLIMDNHSNHASIWSHSFCQINCIIMVSIPPHTPHRMQPLGISSFEPLKSAYNRECTLYTRNLPPETIRKEEISSLRNTACKQIAAIAEVVSQFVIAGIYPLNPMCWVKVILFLKKSPLQGVKLCNWVGLALSDKASTQIM
jgi:hypothetical protein